MKYLIILISYLLISSSVFAQSAKGRLADGRPYRVDEQGIRLSDYIAEIEVTNEELRQQVTSLEDELAETNRKLNASGNSNCLASNTTKQKDVNLSELTELKQELANARAQLTNQTTCNYQSTANPYYSKVKELEAELAKRPTSEQLSYLSKQSEISSLELSKLKSANDLQKEQLNNLKKQLQTSFSDKEGLYQDLINKNRDSEENYNKVTNDNLELKQKVANLEKEIQANNSLKNLLEEKEDEIANLKASINSQNQRAALVYTETPKAATLTTEPSLDKTIVSYKSELRGQLQKIQTLILQRKNSLDNLKNKKSGILVSIQPLVASSGMSLDKIRLAVDNLSSEDEVKDLKSALAEISKILNEDIAVINRLLH